MTQGDFLKGLRNKIGVYHLWVDYDNCDDHDTYTMLCVYVGKGIVLDRINVHIKKKWPRQEQLYVSFYECSNRISKYLEQLFLDTYGFYLNNNENYGKKHLFAVWNHDRYLLGTEIDAVSQHSKITGLDDI